MSADALVVSVIVVSYNTREMTMECLRTLQTDLRDLSAEIWLVDNASTDGSVDAIRTTFPKVNVIANTRNLGFGAANNQAMQQAKGDCFLLINSDAFPRPGAIRTMLSCLEAHPQVAAVGPCLRNRDGSLQRSCYRFPSPLRCLWENMLLTAAFPNDAVFGDYRAWAHDSERYVDFVTGAALLVRRTVVEQIGHFDTNFFMYAEETDWQLRMHRAGWQVLFCPQAEVTHWAGHSATRMKDRQFCEFNRATARYIRKHYGPGGWCVQRVAIVIGAMLRLMVWSLVYLTGGQRQHKAARNIRDWFRLLRWWTGGGPHEGLAEN
jgi:N-acetylglucosaminyl-diphospho-decaprenol L-rhamnosyltransferase